MNVSYNEFGGKSTVFAKNVSPTRSFFAFYSPIPNIFANFANVFKY